MSVRYSIYSHIRRFLRPKNEAKTRGSSYIQKCTEVNGYQVADFGSSLGGRLICEVAL